MIRLFLYLTVVLFLSCKKDKEESQPAPFVDFTYTLSPIAPQVVTFSAQPNKEGTITWNFGDGGSGQGNEVTHTYSSQGVYQVTVELNNSGGNASRKKRVNASSKTKMSVISLEATAPAVNSSGLAWDTEAGETEPDLFARIYGLSGNQLIPGSPVLFSNSFAMNYNLNPAAETTHFEQDLIIKLFDRDVSSDELIGEFRFDFNLTLVNGPFYHTYTVPRLSGAGTMKMTVLWSE